MSKMRIAVTIDDGLVERIDRMVAQKRFPSRSSAFELAVRTQIQRLDRLARECAKLDQRGERFLAEGGALQDLAGWPDYLGSSTSSFRD